MAFCSKCGKELAADTKFCATCGAPADVAAAGTPAPVMTAPQAGTGLQKNVAGLLCYVLGWITGIIFLLIEKDRFVRFHAVQSIITFGALQLVQFLLSWIIFPLLWRSLALGFLATLLNFVLGVGTFALWILLMVKAYNNQMYKLPFAGDLAEQHSK